MPKTWAPDEGRKLVKWIKQQGFPVTVYTVNDINRRVAPYEDSQLYSAHTFVKWHPIVAGCPMTAGTTSADGLCRQFGPVYEKPPAGMRPLAGPGPQVAGPLDGDTRSLDDAEISGLEKRVAEVDERRAKAKAKKKGWF